MRKTGCPNQYIALKNLPPLATSARQRNAKIFAERFVHTKYTFRTQSAEAFVFKKKVAVKSIQVPIEMEKNVLASKSAVSFYFTVSNTN